MSPTTVHILELGIRRKFKELGGKKTNEKEAGLCLSSDTSSFHELQTMLLYVYVLSNGSIEWHILLGDKNKVSMGDPPSHGKDEIPNGMVHSSISALELRI